MTLLRIASTPALGASVIAPVGDLDMGSADQLQESVANADARADVIVDLRRVAFIDSTGLLALVRAADAVRTHGRRLHVIPGPPCLDRLLDITQMRSRIRFVEPQAADTPAAELWLG